MYRLFEFIRRSYVTILFVVLEIAAVNRYMHSTPYTRARILSKVAAVAGWVSSGTSKTVNYFGLAGENRMLTARIAELEGENALLRAAAESVMSADSLPFASEITSPYTFIPARVVANSVNRTHNFITMNKGLRDGVTPESAVATPAGAVVGYVLECSERYSVAVSVLNTSFRTSGKIADSNFSGSIEWRAANPHEVTFCEVSKYADIVIGSKIVTTGFSHYFMPDMSIGTVVAFDLDETHTSYTATVRLAADMSRLQNVLIIKNTDRDAIIKLEEAAENAI